MVVRRNGSAVSKRLSLLLAATLTAASIHPVIARAEAALADTYQAPADRTADVVAEGEGRTPSEGAGSPLMRGAPPAPGLLVTPQNWLQPPFQTWSLQHLEQIARVTTVDRGEGAATPMGPLWLDLSGYRFPAPDGRVLGLEEALAEMRIDALLVWQKGSLRLERYRNGQTPRTRHAMLTASAAVTGLLAEMLIEDKRFDDMRLVSFYLPELRGSAWNDVSVRETLDMEVALDFREVYGDPWSDYSQLLHAGGMGAPAGDIRIAPSLHEFLHGVRGQGAPAMSYQYASANVEVIGWLMHRVTGQSVAELYEERLHGRIGAERDAQFATDPIGMTVASSGLAITARDLLRLGVMLAQGGQYNFEQIVPPDVVSRLLAGGERRHAMPGDEAAPFYSYRSGWHLYHPAGRLSAWGTHGQFLFVSPREEVVAVIQSSHPEPWGPHIALADALYRSLVDYLGAGH